MSNEQIRFVLGTTAIDYDPNKEEQNKSKHGYSLSCAQDVIEQLLLLQKPALHRSYMRGDEERFDMMTEYQNRIVHITATMRKGDVVRVISMRDASEKERKEYEENPPQFDISALLGD